MIKSLFLSSWRKFAQRPASTVINLLGLTFGLVCCQVIGTYLYHELNYDRHHSKADRIFRVTHNEKAGEIPGIRHLATVGPPLGPALANEVAAVENTVRFRYAPEQTVQVGETRHYESRVWYADPSVLEVFTFPLSAGNPQTALSLPNNVVITEEMAVKYFGNSDPIGKTILINQTSEYKVSGVLQHLPENSHLKFDFLLPFEAFKVPYGYPVNLTTWGWISFHTYVLLRPGYTQADLENQLPNFVAAHWPEERAKRFKLQLQPLTDIYLGDVLHEQVASGNKTYLWVMTCAGFLVLLMATFNFANLFVTTSLSRTKEVGVRKMMGANRRSIRWHIAGEAIIIALTAGLASIALLPASLNYLAGNGIAIALPFKLYPVVAGYVLLAATLAGLLAALYPSTLLTRLTQQHLLKGRFFSSVGGITLRRGLIFVQFAITMALLSSVLVIERQMNFIRDKDLGYRRDELLLLQMPGESLTTRFNSLKVELMKNPLITEVSLGGGRMDGDNGNVPIYAGEYAEEGIPMSIDAAPFDFLRTIGVEMVAGREISERNPGDTLRGVLLNESAIKVFGWTPEEALGKRIRVGEIVREGEVIGVFPDFHFASLRSAIGPLVMSFPRTRLSDIYVRFDAAANPSELIQSMAADWARVVPEFPFDYKFLTVHLEHLYQSEKHFSLLFRLFAIMAMVISCLGLFAVVSQEVLYRVREIGIRKILGASILNVVVLICKPFSLLIVAATLVAFPLSWTAMQQWLSEFSYHTNLTWWIFAFGSLLTVAIALGTILIKTIRAGMANPVDSLQSD